MPDKQKAVISIAAGKSQIITIKKVRELGFSVISIDQNPMAPGFEYSDEMIHLSTYDAKPIIERLKELEMKYTFIFIINRSSGLPVITAAKLAEAFKIKMVPSISAKTIINKHLLFQYCKEKNISTPTSTAFTDINMIELSNINLPCIIKPSLSLIGKSGVSLVTDKNNLMPALKLAFKTSMNSTISIENYITGSDVSFISFVTNKEIKLHFLIDEVNSIKESGEHQGKGYAIPSKFSKTSIETKIISLAEKLISFFDIDTSPLNFSCRVSPDGTIFLIEIHLDIGGDLIYDHLIPHACNCDILLEGLKILTKIKTTNFDISFQPSSIIYSHETSLISDNPFKIHTEKSRQELEKYFN